MGDTHGRGDDETNQYQPADQRDGLAAVQQPVLQRIRHAGGDQSQEQETFLFEDGEHVGPYAVGKRIND
ncbi:hypothetical protein D3C84_1200220 [compost metagenome]